MSAPNVQKLWKQHWSEKTTIEETGSFYGKLLHQKRLIILKNILKTLDPTSSVLDMGCGGGSTISTFKQSGFVNIKGIDFTQESMHHCEKLGLKQNKDVFLMDASNTSFQDNSFDIIFSEGLWEHFTDPRPHIAEAARLAKTYIIVIQPDHFSFFGYLMHLGWQLFAKSKGGVREYSFQLSYFSNFLKMYNFDLVLSKSTPLHEQTIMVFKKKAKWRTAQQHEQRYIHNTEDKIWSIPYSFEYWEKFFNLNLKGQGIEVCCGNHGIYNFTSNITGFDSINFHKSNFVLGVAEHLPFKSVDYIICGNGIDHCQNPKQVLNEFTKATNKIILWVYTHPKITSFILSKLDKMHPHHFTKQNLNKLLSNIPFVKTFETSYSPLCHWRYTKTRGAKIKLLIMYLLNIQGNCIHLEKSNCPK
jgi:ubiquinone/menaquinone biosynthesis C-methylase UbiE